MYWIALDFNLNIEILLLVGWEKKKNKKYAKKENTLLLLKCKLNGSSPMTEKQSKLKEKQRREFLLLIDDAKLLDEFNWMLYGHGWNSSKWASKMGKVCCWALTFLLTVIAWHAFVVVVFHYATLDTTKETQTHTNTHTHTLIHSCTHSQTRKQTRMHTHGNWNWWMAIKISAFFLFPSLFLYLFLLFLFFSLSLSISVSWCWPKTHTHTQTHTHTLKRLHKHPLLYAEICIETKWNA